MLLNFIKIGLIIPSPKAPVFYTALRMCQQSQFAYYVLQYGFLDGKHFTGDILVYFSHSIDTCI